MSSRTACEKMAANPAVEGSFAIRPLAPSLLRYAPEERA
jgi:hypothetical protein